jgi:hypothetical protein
MPVSGYVLFSPLYEGIANDPRAEEIKRRMKLPLDPG